MTSQQNMNKELIPEKMNTFLTQCQQKQLIPVILMPTDAKKILRLKKSMIGIPHLASVNNIKSYIRNQLKLEKDEALFIVCQKQFINEMTQCLDLYLKYKNPQDQFLHLYYSVQQAFG